MPSLRTITSDSQLGASGLYIKEEQPPQLVQGVQNNTVGVAGECVRGPVDVAVDVTSPARFLEVFGGRDYGTGGAVAGKVWQALVGKRFGRIKAIRVAAAAATTAEADFVATATPIINVAANGPGTWGNDIRVTIADASDGDANHFNLTATWNGREVTYENLDTSATGNDNLDQVIGDDPGRLVVVTKLADGRPDNAVDQALTDTAGANGTVADSDYTKTNGAIDILSADPDTAINFIAGQSTSAVKSDIISTAATLGPSKTWLVCPDDETITASAAITEVDAFTQVDRVSYWYGHYNTLDPSTALDMVVEPHSLAASILSQIDPEISPANLVRNAQFAAGVRSLATPALAVSDYDSFATAHINALERRPRGWGFVEQYNLLRVAGENVALRRMKDFLLLAAASRATGTR